VDLQQVDIIHIQTPEAVINGSQDLRTGKAFRQITHLVIYLGGDDHIVTAGKIAQGAADNLFAAAVGVTVGSIKKVNPAVECAFDDKAAVFPNVVYCMVPLLLF
jgi:hypothetical protein